MLPELRSATATAGPCRAARRRADVGTAAGRARASLDRGPGGKAELQASGEAQYADDVPLPAGTVYVAYAQTAVARPGSRVSTPLPAGVPGVLGFFDANDIPAGANRHGGGAKSRSRRTRSTPGSLRHRGRHAPARTVRREAGDCQYERDDGAPILTNHEALARDSFYPKMSEAQGDFAAIAEAPMQGRRGAAK